MVGQTPGHKATTSRSRWVSASIILGVPPAKLGLDTNSSINRRVTPGESNASPAATTRTARANSAAEPVNQRHGLTVRPGLEIAVRRQEYEDGTSEGVRRSCAEDTWSDLIESFPHAVDIRTPEHRRPGAGLLVGEDRRRNPADAFGVGDRIDLDDLASATVKPITAKGRPTETQQGVRTASSASVSDPNNLKVTARRWDRCSSKLRQPLALVHLSHLSAPSVMRVTRRTRSMRQGVL